MADPKLGGSTIGLRRSVRSQFLALQLSKLLVLEGMVVDGGEFAGRVRESLILVSAQALVQSPLTRRESRLCELAARQRVRHAAPPRVNERLANRCCREPLYLLLGERPCLPLSRLRGTCYLARSGTGNGRRGPDNLGVAIGVSFRAGLIAVRDAVNLQIVEAWPRVPLLLQRVLYGCCGLVVARIRRGSCSQPHITKALINPTVHTLSPRHGLGNVAVAAEGCTVGRRVTWCLPLETSGVATAWRDGGYHGRDTHVAVCW